MSVYRTQHREAAYAKTSGYSESEAVHPTGQYPDDVWATDDYSAVALAENESDSNVDDVADAFHPTGQYPDDVWATDDYSAVALAEDESDSNVDDVADAFHPTGQYPDDIWATNNYDAAALAADIDVVDSKQAKTVVNPSEGAKILLSLKSVDYTDEIGSAPDPERSDAQATHAILDLQEMYQIIRQVAAADSGEALYSAISANQEFLTPGQPAYQQRQFGLGFGLLLFTQESGHLGQVLQIMQRREPALFAEIFGAGALALLSTATAATPNDRLQPVEGHALWEDYWTERFRQAGQIPAFQAAQNEAAIEHIFRPMLPTAHELGFVTDRGLAMVLDQVVTHGLGAGLRWVVEVAGVLQTASQRQMALQVLGYKTLTAFQAATGWTPQNGVFGPETHAALMGALRRQASIPLPTTTELMQRLLVASNGTSRLRLERLRDSKVFEDITYEME